jgi:hypothetical protein
MIPWTASRIDIANYCRMRYYLRYVEKENSLRLSAYAKGTLLHDLIENFWNKLGTEEEVAKKASKKKYSNSQEFAKYAKGLWSRTVIASQNSKNPIQWAYDNEQWVINSELSGICVPLYSILLKEGKPVFSEIGFDFLIEGKRFRGRIDDIRIRNGKIVIRDYKSGKPWIGEMKLNNDPQLTLYNIGLCSLCSQEEIAGKLGLLEERKKFMGNPFYIYPDFVEEFFMIEAPAFNIKKNHSLNFLNQTTRKDEHFFELLNMIKGIERAVSEGEIYPERGRKCDYCDMKYSCEKRLEKTRAGHLEDRTGQGFFSFAIPAYARKEEQQGYFKQKKIRFSFKK